MNWIMGHWMVVALVVTVAASVGVALWLRKAPKKSVYKAKALLTANELEFLGRLERACPELRFHGQVSMGALMEVDLPAGADPKQAWSLRGKFSQKIVDFVAQERSSGKVTALIELDDRTHDAAKDAERDAMTASAGYKTIRWSSSKRPSESEIRKALLG